MITLAIILVLVLAILIPTILIGSLGGGVLLIVFGDAILAILIMVGLIKKLFFKNDKK